MLLFEKWKESYVSFFDKKNFTEFSLICLKTMLQTYKAWFLFFGWALVLYIVLDALHPVAHVPGFLFLGPESISWTISAWLRFIGWYALLFGIYLSCRPSVLPKSVTYYLGYMKHFVYFLLGIFLANWLSYIFAFEVSYSAPVHMYDMGISTCIALATLFFLHGAADMKNFVMSAIRGLKMWFYNLPVFCIVGFSFFISLRILGKIVVLLCYAISLKAGVYPTLFTEWLERGVYLFVMPIPICIITNIYIKKVYEEFSLYFPSDAIEEGA